MKSPSAPNPAKVAAAQSGMNVDTAIAQQLVNQTDQQTPDGSLSYTQNGNTTYTDSTGHVRSIPKFTATQSLTPEGQHLHDLNNEVDVNTATLARDQSAKLNGLLSQPVDLSNDAVEAHLMDLGTRRLNPHFARDEESLRTRLVNSGIRQGSDAWNTEMDDFNQHKADALDQLLLTGHGQSEQDILTARNQPINEITALMSGSQVSQPNFAGTPQAGVGGVDYAGMVQQNYQQKMASHNAMMGGLFGLGGAAIGAAAGKPPGV